MNELTHLDLFSGIGGFSLGFENAGFRTIAFCETDPDASLVLAHHWPDVPNLGDVTKLCRRAYDCQPQDEKGNCHCPRCGTGFGECACIGTDEFTDTFGFPFVITGGVPCQPASALGAMRGAADERWLWPEALRVVRELRPPFAVFENPPSVLVLPDFLRVIGEITALGYDLWWDVISCAALGAGHLRERVFFILADAQYPGSHRQSQLRRQREEMGRHEHAGEHGEHGEIAAHGSGGQTHHGGSGHLDAPATGRQGSHPSAGAGGDDVANAASGNKFGSPVKADSLGTQRDARVGAPNQDAATPAHAHQPGLEGQSGHVPHGGRWPEPRRPVATPHLQQRVCRPDWWSEAVTGIPVLVHGLPSRLVEAAVRCAGNAVVPELAQVIAEAIRQVK